MEYRAGTGKYRRNECGVQDIDFVKNSLFWNILALTPRQIIDDMDLISPRKESVRYMRSNESGTPGYYHLLCSVHKKLVYLFWHGLTNLARRRRTLYSGNAGDVSTGLPRKEEYE